MTNNQFCSLLSVCGCLALFISMVLMFFGVSPAIWGAAAGALIGFLGLVNFD